MEDLIDLIATDSAASQVTSSIKDILFAKAAERVDALRPEVANSMFGEGEPTDKYTEDQE
jgi:hypothetical protein